MKVAKLTSKLILLQILTLSSSNAVPSPYSAQELNNTSGLFYQDLGLARVYDQYFTLYHYRNLTMYEMKLDQINNVYNQSVDICKDHQDLGLSTYCSNSLNLIQTQIPALKKKFEAITHLIGRRNRGTNRKNKRGLLNIVGTGLKWLFGTPDADDVAQFQQKIGILQLENRESQILIQKQAQILSTAINAYNESVQEFKLNIMILNKNIEELFKAQEGIKRSMHQTTTAIKHLTLLSQLILHLNDEFDNVIDSILFAKLNILHPSILTPNELIEELRNVSLNSDLQFPIDDIDQMYQYFNIIEMTLVLCDNILVSVLKIPTPYKAKFSLYHLIPFPKSTNYNIFSFIIPQKPYLLLAVTMDTFNLMGSLDSCKQLTDYYLCPNKLSSVSAEGSCEVQLKTKDLNAIPKDCQIKSAVFDMELYQKINTDEWLYATTSKVIGTVTCNDVSSDIRLKGTGILKLEPGCMAHMHSNNLVAYTKPAKHYSHFIPEIDINLDPRYLQQESALKAANITAIEWKDTHMDALQDAQDKLKKVDETLEDALHRTYASTNEFVLYVLSLVAFIMCLCIGLYCFFRGRSSKSKRAIYVKK